ncbi:MAG: MFS transporter [Thermodesulfobacteriota bacterium]
MRSEAICDSKHDATSKGCVLLVATLASFLTPFIGSSVNIALPSIGKEFHMDAVLLSWISTSFLLSAAMFLVPFGRVADIYGRKKVFLSGISIYTLACLLSALSPSAGVLIASRVMQGIGSSMIFGTGVAILTSVFPAGERGRALGINVASVYLGLSLGPFIGGSITEHFGWRAIFLANIPLGLLIILLVIGKIKGEWAEARGEKLDIIGSIIYGFSLMAIMYGFSQPSISGMALIGMGLFGAITFLKWETKAESPLLEINLFRANRVFTFSNLAALINYSATFGVAFLLSLYLQYVKGLSPQNAGVIMVAQPIVMTVFSPFAGRLSDRMEPRVVASTGMALITIGLSLFIFLNEKTALLLIVADLALLGLGFALFSSPNTNAIMSSVSRKFYGVTSGIVATMRMTGQMLSMGVVMLLFAAYIGRVPITPPYYPLFLKSVKSAFVIFSALCFAGIFASLARGKLR